VVSDVLGGLDTRFPLHSWIRESKDLEEDLDSGLGQHGFPEVSLGQAATFVVVATGVIAVVGSSLKFRFPVWRGYVEGEVSPAKGLKTLVEAINVLLPLSAFQQFVGLLKARLDQEVSVPAVDSIGASASGPGNSSHTQPSGS
jgi:hypothetical protein